MNSIPDRRIERTISKPGHTPFTISSPYLYYIGFLDFAPGEIGYHVKGEMAGVWHHPIRILKNLWFEISGRRIAPLQVKITPFSLEADFGSLKCNIGFRSQRELVITAGTNGSSEVRLKLDVSPASAWLSNIVPDVTISGRQIRSAASFNGVPVESSLIFSENPESMEGSIIQIPVKGELTACILLPTPSDSPAHGDIDAMYYRDLSYNRIDCENQVISDAYEIAKVNMMQLMSHSPVAGYGITAGHPDFPWFFGIDTLLSVRGMMMSGMFDEVKYSLDNLIAHSAGGRIPHEVVTNGHIYNAGDLEESAIFPWMFNEYVQWSGDLQFARRHSGKLSMVAKYVINSGMSGRGIMEDIDAGTGIDIDTVSFFARSIDALLDLGRVIDDSSMDLDLHELTKTRKDIVKMIRNDFWISEAGTFANRIVDGIPLDKGFWTSIVPFYAGVASESQYKKFVSAGGGLNRISEDSGIRVGSEGNIMPMNNGMMAMGAIQYGDLETFRKYFDLLGMSIGSLSPISFPEIVNNPEGCYLQAWSAAFYAECLAMGGLGISLKDGRLTWKPDLSGKILGGWVKIRDFRFRSGTVNLGYPEP